MTTPPSKPPADPISPELRRRWRLVIDSSLALLVVAAALTVWALLTPVNRQASLDLVDARSHA